MVNNLIFDDITMLAWIKGKITEYFATDEWLIFFGGKELEIAEITQEVYTSFPVVDISLRNISANGTTINNGQHTTTFIVNIEVYTKNLPNINREILASKITNEIILIIQGFSRRIRLLINNTLPTTMINVTRRLSQIQCEYSNFNNKFN